MARVAGRFARVEPRRRAYLVHSSTAGHAAIDRRLYIPPLMDP
ncbi:hypothetical protein ACIRED_16200 [Streptomyces roseolilacinus]